MVFKVFIFILIQFLPLAVWYYLLKRKNVKIDWRLILSYFVFGSWFGMMGELFLYKIIEWIFHMPIWEYKTFPIHNGITSSFGSIMWGNAAVYICFHKNYQLLTLKRKSLMKSSLFEAGFLLVIELIFNFIAFLLFNDYFFYYFVPDLWHWSSFTNLPFWWVGYKFIVKFASLFYKEEKLNISLAILITVVLFAYQ